jgi:hypothetical protein
MSWRVFRDTTGAAGYNLTDRERQTECEREERVRDREGKRDGVGVAGICSVNR